MGILLLEFTRVILKLNKQSCIHTIMLIYFASGTELVVHKTFHSYTVRAKQGGSQSSRDNKSGGGSHPKSAGASLRRYNEAAFAEVFLLFFFCIYRYLRL